MENELREIEEKEIITEEDIDESDPENKKYDESRIYYVYEHIRLDKMEPFYIGKGKGERAYDLYRNDHHDAITDKYGHAVVIIADNLTEEEAYWLERDTIEDYVFNLGNGIDIEGHKDYDHALPHLTNMNWGGRGGSSGLNPYANKTEEEMEEISKKKSEAMKGRKNSEEHNKNISEATKGKKVSEEAKKHMSEAHKGKKLSEEHKKKISESSNGKKMSDEAKRKMSESHKGRKHSDEAKQKMRESSKGKNKGRKHSGEHNRKISESMKGKNKGRKHSDEAKLNMSKAHNKKVVCITTGEEFNSVKEAGNHYYINQSNIVYCCKGKRKHAGKLQDGTPLQWKYLKDYDNEFKGILINPITE